MITGIVTVLYGVTFGIVVILGHEGKLHIANIRNKLVRRVALAALAPPAILCGFVIGGLDAVAKELIPSVLSAWRGDD